jgi:uncharacterized protein (DUF1800 family)
MQKKSPKIYLLLIIVKLGLLVKTQAQSTIYALSDKVSIVNYKSNINENWPVPSTIVIRRSGGLKALTIPISISGTATFGFDYLSNFGKSLTIPAGKNEVWINISPIKDNLTEPDESLKITLENSPNFKIEGSNFSEITITDGNSLPTDDEAVRFLIQAGFGADPDELLDVKTLGFEAWIDQQINRPKSYLQPIITAKNLANYYETDYNSRNTIWHLVMRRRYLPSGGTVETDILRQRIAYSLSQIFVISQTGDALAVNPKGVLNYYDKLMDGAFGNFRQLLFDVSIHPCMGSYLSHVKNVKPNPATNTFPDENYAREIMQLFSIGLWKLNQNGTRQLDANNKPIPTYNNKDISNFARVFTGLAWGGPSNANRSFEASYDDFEHNMVPYEDYHDTDQKTLLNGMILPAGRTTLQDIAAAVDNLFNHQNTGPFIARLLIQRLVTSNPSPEYIERVANKFSNNGQNIRGDMGAVVKQILLDPEARSYAKTKEPTFGKMREPYLTLLNFAKTFNAQPPSGDYHEGNQFYDYYLQEPFLSPSVFNFYSPNFRPPGQLTTMGKFAPEFQILTAVTAIEASNNLLNSIEYYITRWGAPNTANQMKFNFSAETGLASDPEAIIKMLSMKLIGGNLRPKSFQLIREAIVKIPITAENWQKERVNLAAYLLGSSAEFNILK